MNETLNALKVGISVECVECHRRKKPVGRSAPLEMANGLCDLDCDGYGRPPFAGSLWPGESEKEFGYPVADEGTENREEAQA